MAKTERTIVPISKDEFCEKTRTTPDGWLFKECKNPKMFKDSESGRQDWYYLIDDNLNEVYRFKNMPEGDEIWVSTINRKAEKADWSIWST